MVNVLSTIVIFFNLLKMSSFKVKNMEIFQLLKSNPLVKDLQARVNLAFDYIKNNHLTEPADAVFENKVKTQLRGKFFNNLTHKMKKLPHGLKGYQGFEKKEKNWLECFFKFESLKKKKKNCASSDDESNHDLNESSHDLQNESNHDEITDLENSANNVAAEPSNEPSNNAEGK